MAQDDNTASYLNPPTAADSTSYANAAPQAEPALAEAAGTAEAFVPHAVFPYAETLSEDPIALRDDLSKVQTNATEAARLSGDHFSRLLYGPDADLHLSPYGVAPTPNSLDSRKP